MNKYVRFDFYKVGVAGTEDSFADILQAVGRMRNDETRNVDLPNGVYRLSKYTKHNNWLEGEVIRIRMDDLPVKAGLKGQVEDMDLADDEGVGEQTAFLFDTKKDLLVLQRNRAGVTRNSFTQYFNRMGGDEVAVDLQPALNRQALKRLAEMKTVSKFEFAIASPHDTTFLDDSNKAMIETIGLARYFQSPTISVTVSRGHSPTYLSLAKVQAVVKRLLSRSGEVDDVTKVKVYGVDSENESDAINFLLDQIQERAPVRYDDKRRTMPYIPRRNAIREALEKWYDEF